jgi:hypothetical protein
LARVSRLPIRWVRTPLSTSGLPLVPQLYGSAFAPAGGITSERVASRGFHWVTFVRYLEARLPHTLPVRHRIGSSANPQPWERVPGSSQSSRSDASRLALDSLRTDDSVYLPLRGQEGATQMSEGREHPGEWDCFASATWLCGSSDLTELEHGLVAGSAGSSRRRCMPCTSSVQRPDVRGDFAP